MLQHLLLKDGAIKVESCETEKGKLRQGLAGQKNIKAVTGLVFSYINILKSSGGVTQDR